MCKCMLEAVTALCEDVRSQGAASESVSECFT